MIINSYDQRYANNRAGIRKLIQVCLAGRAAELLYWKSEDMLSAGASSDISKATAYVKTAVTKLGFSLEEHLVDYGQFSESQSDVQKEVKLWMQDGHTKVTTLLENNWDKVEKLAQLLLKEKCLFKKDLVGILDNECKLKRVH